MSQPDPTLERLQHLAAECACSLQPARHEDSGEGWHIVQNQGGEILAMANVSTNQPFVWISRRIVAGDALRHRVALHLADCVQIARHYGCAINPAVGSGLVAVEIGLPLFYSAMSYYAFKDALAAVEAASSACLQVLDPLGA